MAWDVLSEVANICVLFCPRRQGWHGMFYPGMFCPTFFFSSHLFLLFFFFQGCFLKFFLRLHEPRGSCESNNSPLKGGIHSPPKLGT